MTYRARCNGRKHRHGRRWFTFDDPGKRGKTYYQVLGTVKLKDFLAEEEAKRIDEWLRAQGPETFELEDE